MIEIVEPTERETDSDVAKELRYRLEQLSEVLEKCNERNLILSVDIDGYKSADRKELFNGIRLIEIKKTIKF